MASSRRLTADQVREVRRLRGGWRLWKRAKDPALKIAAIAQRFGVSPSCISHILRGRFYRDVTP